ncbi:MULTISPECIES: potassium/proton antiporter [Deinococcus]|jgi:cell volume regulation protein A|uniref:Cell volume regulation protein A n=1 Tax=Deinococcus enclensis TaxID=1049582 RepID=A0ABT9MEE2_9DEIO|nr:MULTISPECIES: potassium/proton antiporter [Deinococcus]MDP9764962.1 cell volume regulation protein A [Deinococcus enclensis]GHF85922.1 K+/H+ antiporter [Deinococcus ficus]
MHEAHAEMYLLVAGVLLITSLVVGRIGGRLGIPGLLLFLGVGMLAGSDGLGIQFSDYRLAQTLGTVALAFILFQGGLSTAWGHTRPVVKMGLSLATLGVLVTAGVMAAFVHFVFGWAWLPAWLLGAIVSSTDASAVFSVLKERALGLKGHVAPLLEFESGGNDPMAVFLTVGILELIAHPGAGVLSILPLFLKQMILGAVLGVVLGRAALWALSRMELQFEGLYSVLSLALALTIFSATAVAGGSGFLAIYIAGVILGNAEFIHKRSLMAFHDGVAWIMQVAMFLTLGLLVNPHELLPTAGLALACALVLVFVARPLSVHLGLALSGMPLPERHMVAWVGLRGAVPIVLATFPLVAGVPQAQTLFNIVFFTVLTSVLIQGTTLARVARLLGVQQDLPAPRHYPISFTPTGHSKNAMIEVHVAPGSAADGLRIMDLKLSPETLVLLVDRAGEYLMPKGPTLLQAGDTLLVLADPDGQGEVRAKLGRPARP